MGGYGAGGGDGVDRWYNHVSLWTECLGFFLGKYLGGQTMNNTTAGGSL